MIEVDKNTFQTEVLEAEGYVFVDFFGDGCVPCAALMPKVHEFADTYGDKLKFISVCVSELMYLWHKCCTRNTSVTEKVNEYISFSFQNLCLERILIYFYHWSDPPFKSYL